MNNKTKAIIVVGGTGGHVFPGCNLAKHLIEENYNVRIVTDKRGLKYLENFKDLKISVLKSSPLISKNIFTIFFSSLLILYSIITSLIFLILNRPSIIFGMGGYASFPLCLAAAFLNIKFVIYENNLVLGKANKYLLPFTEKLIVSFKELEGVPTKYQNKIHKIGNIIKKEIINFSLIKNENINIKKFNILVLGGSQAAKIFAEILPKIFSQCNKHGVIFKIFQHCLPHQNEKLKSFYENMNIDFETFNFSHNLNEYFSKTNLAITRSGASMLAELTNANIPFISVPLPSSADGHQLKNAIYYQKKKMAFLIEEKDLNDQLFSLIKDISKNNSILVKMSENQRQYSDKNVYKNINQVVKEIIDEKN